MASRPAATEQSAAAKVIAHQTRRVYAGLSVAMAIIAPKHTHSSIAGWPVRFCPQMQHLMRQPPLPPSRR